MKKRDIFAEVMEGIAEMAAEREGKVTLKTFVRTSTPSIPPPVTAAEIKATRKKLNVSQAVFASVLQLNKRTLERWEQGSAKPNAQASLLIRLVDRDPELIKRIRETEVALAPKRATAKRVVRPRRKSA